MANKTNPRRIPKTQADVDRARNEGFDFAFEFVSSIQLFILADKYGWTVEQIQELITKFEFYCSQINAGEINYNDIVDTVRKEYGFDVTMNRKKG